jgi:hypothetical protein
MRSPWLQTAVAAVRDDRVRPSAPLALIAGTLAAWISIIALGVAFGDRPTGETSAAPRATTIHTPSARPGRAGPASPELLQER